MIRTQIQLEEGQAERLRHLAAAEGISLSEAIRRAVDALLASAARAHPREVRARAASLAGRYDSGLDDLATAHDTYLAEAFEE